MKCILGIDQSTQGTKLALVDDAGKIKVKKFRSHRQIVDNNGWISHDMNEIYDNILLCVREIVHEHLTEDDEIVAVAICNQRETTIAWNEKGQPVTNAVVWQCARSMVSIENILKDKDLCDHVKEKTGLPISPFFPASKMKWLSDQKCTDNGKIYYGTVDSFLIYRLTCGSVYATDYTNASRTQLFDIEKLCWDDDLCRIFGVYGIALPKILKSDAEFGLTDFGGILNSKVPIHAVMGDSHAALYGQGCFENGMIKATFGTGSSLMMNTGKNLVRNKGGLITSIGFYTDENIHYCVEGNINYAGASITWMKEKLKIMTSESKLSEICNRACESDRTVFIPAFTGLSRPYYRDDIRAAFLNMEYYTGREEMIRAVVESIGNQVADIIDEMEIDDRQENSIKCDGGPTENEYLMKYLAGITNRELSVSDLKELSLIGVTYAAGIAMKIYDKEIFTRLTYKSYTPQMSAEYRRLKRKDWLDAIDLLIKRN